LGHGGAVCAGRPLDVAVAAARGQRQRRTLGQWEILGTGK
jgi:hypothetical protein